MASWLAVGFAAVAFLSTLAGGLAALRWPGSVPALAALAGGIVLGAAFFDLLPNAVGRASGLPGSAGLPLGACLAGFLFFYTLERFLHHHHEAGEGPGAAGLVGASGFVVHSLFDGLAIGLGFRVDAGLGVLVALAVVGHDFSDGLNTVSYLLTHRQGEARSLRWLLADALAPIAGALAASWVALPTWVFVAGLGFFAGLFIYVAALALLPQATRLEPRRAVPLTLAGALAMFVITRLV